MTPGGVVVMANKPNCRLSGLDYSAAHLQTKSPKDYHYEAHYNAGDTETSAQDGKRDPDEAEDQSQNG